MSKLDLHKTYTELSFKTWNNLVFFVPNIFFELETLDESTKEMLKNTFDQKLLIVGEPMNIFEYDFDTDGTKYINQMTNLGKILFDLLQLKSQLKDFEFSYLLDQYYVQAECCLSVTNWIKNNTNQIKNLDNKVRGIFNIQFNTYRKHFEDLIKQFYPNPELMPEDRLNVLQLIKTNFKSIKSNITVPNQEISELNNSKEHPINTKAFFDNLLEQTTKYKARKTELPKQKVLVTEQQAKKAILSQIFNIQE
ncbi:hypothetical protein [uncultured Olleya sp.]|uniref:hypothetical protein n=1 Tax=uncultured Olleya sp. TaxID=757243 RepID=UPI0032B10AD4|tara:strand:+ start:1341 stop:2093 length:753 start_codon:yes stop_codon:yes gene_type:complete